MRLNLHELKNSRSFITQVLKGATSLAVGVGIYSLCSFIFKYILIHTWTPSDYGIFTFIFTIVGLLVIPTEFNLNATAAIFLARDIKNTANKRTLAEILFIFVFLVLFSLVITFGVTRFSSGSETLGIFRNYFCLIWLLVIFTGLTGISWGVLRAYKKMNYEAISNAVRGVSILGLVSFAVYFVSRNSIISVMSILIIAQILALLIAVALLSKVNPVSVRSLTPKILGDALRGITISNIRSILVFSFFMSALSISTTLLLSLDRIMIPQFLSAAMLGFYGGASFIVSIPKLVTATVATSIIPFISEKSRDIAEIKKHYLNFLIFFVFSALIGYGLFFYFTPYLVLFLLTEEYGWTILTTRILLIGMFFADIYSLNATFAASAGRTKVLKQIMMALAGAVVANFALNWVLIPKLGIEGAAIASVISYAIAGLISTMQVIRIKHFLEREEA